MLEMTMGTQEYRLGIWMVLLKQEDLPPLKQLSPLPAIPTDTFRQPHSLLTIDR